MEKNANGIYFGVDINSKSTMISYYQLNMKEPNTISTVVGSEAYQIPTAIAKKRGISQWYFGKEAIDEANSGSAVLIENLYEKALNDEAVTLETETFSTRKLLTLYLKKLLGIPGRFEASRNMHKITISVPEVDLQVISLFNSMTEELGIEKEKLQVIDHKESFYYYALSQNPALFQNDVVLYDFSGNSLKFRRLMRNTGTKPQIINFDDDEYDLTGRSKDETFADIVRHDLSGRMTSTVYLIGDGFDGDWMKLSLNEICRNRRAFSGKNLYSKGACYAGAIKDGMVDWPFVYIGDNEMKLNLALKVVDGNEMKFYTMLSAGEPWYDAVGECEVILDGSPEIECWIQRPDSREAKIQVLTLTDLPERESRTTRLRITATPVSDDSVRVDIRDLGFGEIIPSSNKSWSHIIYLTTNDR